MVVEDQSFLEFLWECAKGTWDSYSEVIVPFPGKDNSKRLYFGRLKAESTPVVDRYRPVDPLKTLFYMPRERVLPLPERLPSRIIAGVKACDLAGLSVLDAALIEGDFVDPVYQAWREETLLIASDCTEITETCHCTVVDGKPYAETGFDVNLSPVQAGYHLTIGSPKGGALLDLLRSRFPLHKTTEGEILEVQTLRQTMTDRVISLNERFSRSDDLLSLRQEEKTRWGPVSETCIGCGACTHICPTCYCLILNDETRDANRGFVKVRSYDSCQWHGYARVAGGATPRPKITDRFRHRYLCKFLFTKWNFGLLGCTGCGRCTEACAGNIDFRKVVKRIVERKEITVVDDPVEVHGS